jgi:hypothetical protein
LPLTPAGDAVPYLVGGLMFLAVGVFLVLWMRRLRRAYDE